ncbi:MAG: hypothetical protein EOP10_14705 [Proteobacteria bacterium]|nr:MAG: hypothetical protein EOP10_14705 [Pseudomonadota bacterium]
MKALTLVTFALFTSTSLFASDLVKSPLIPRNSEVPVMVGKSSADIKSLLPQGSTRFADRATARASNLYLAHISRMENDQSNPSASDESMAEASGCLSFLLDRATHGSSCMANLLIGLRDLAANQCGITAVEVKQLRGTCGLR